MERIETTILRNLIFDEEYSRKVIPFIQPDYFENKTEKIIFEESTQFIVKYDAAITVEALNIEIENRTDLTETEIKEARDTTKTFDDAPVDSQWLLDSTEKWCRDRAIYLALMESIALADGQDDKKGRDAIPSILSDALAVSFDNHVGHDYLEDYEERFESYHRKESRIQFDLELFNKITKGGLPNKTLNIALAGTGVGKSLFMCHHASSVLLDGKNVLYITLEMAEEKIAERIDANLLNVNIQNITELPKPMFESKVNNITKKTQGTLIIKEYPTASAHSGHFKSLLNELALKKSFVPDIIFIDYLNICASSRYRTNNNVNSYSYIKAIAEELRGLAVELMYLSSPLLRRLVLVLVVVMLILLIQVNPLVSQPLLILCLLLYLLRNLEALNQIMVKQLKNRYNDPTIYKRFVVGVDRAKMRLYDCEQQAQDDILDNKKDEEYNDEEKKPFKKSFAEFKF